MPDSADLTAARGIGRAELRPDAYAKARGEFEYSNDLSVDGMLHGAVLRSPHPYARILSIDLEPARRMDGVHAAIASWDVPDFMFGLVERDEYVLAYDYVRYVGEPVALVAADDFELAQRALAAIKVDYEPLPPLTDPMEAISAPPIHPDGNLFRHIEFSTGDPDARGEVTVENRYRLGRQDQTFLGPEAGLATPDDSGGVELQLATQWMHSDRDQIAFSLGLPREKVTLRLSGVGGAFGGREDVTFQIHACMLAMFTQRPVKMQFTRAESFHAHRKRHPGTIWLRHEADRDGKLVAIKAQIILDGGAYHSTSAPILSNTASLVQGPYRVPNGHVEAWAVRTNNPICGAMRGFGVPQASYVHEAQMDRLAKALEMDPVELRLLNALGDGDRLMFGQLLDGPTPVREVIERCRAMPLPPDSDASGPPSTVRMPGGVGRAGSVKHTRRGVGLAAVIKNVAFSEAVTDESTAQCTVRDGKATLHCAAVEVGQGFVTVARQIARSVLGVDDVTLARPDTLIASAGSTSASRQTQSSGGAVEKACQAVKQRLLRYVARTHQLDVNTLDLVDGHVVDADGRQLMTIADAGDGRFFQATERFVNRPTRTLDDMDSDLPVHITLAYSAQRAVVDVDVELGLVKVVQIDVCQDVGRIANPLQLHGQIEGGVVQGMGLAIMENLKTEGGHIVNPDLQFYLVPTIVDAPRVNAEFVERGEPGAPFGMRGSAEIPLCNAIPAVAAAVRDATGLDLTAVPIEPQDIALGDDQNAGMVPLRLESNGRNKGPWAIPQPHTARNTAPWTPTPA
jgi:xanthine dehydrogenase D subunit